MKLSIKSCLELMYLLEERVIKKTDFSNKILEKGLLENYSIIIDNSRPKMIVLKNKESLFNCLSSNGFKLFCINDIKEYVQQLEKETVSKDEILKFNKSSKSRESNSFYGINLSVFENTNIYLNKNEFTLQPFEAGSYLFFMRL